MKTEPESGDAKKIWFPAKSYGWGWGPPVCWQGWVVMGVYLVALAGGSVMLRDPKRAPIYFGYGATLTILLLLVCWWKGEKPEWRWGDKPDKKP